MQYVYGLGADRRRCNHKDLTQHGNRRRMGGQHDTGNESGITEGEAQKQWG